MTDKQLEILLDKYVDGNHQNKNTPKKKPNGYWKSDDNFNKEIDLLIEEMGYLPSDRKLKSLGRNDISRAISKRGGMVKLRKKLDLSQTKKGPTYWKKWENIVSEMKDAILNIGEFPSQSELCSQGYSGLNSAISRYHGGLPTVRDKMHYDPSNEKPRGYWKDKDNVHDTLRRVIEDLGHFPTQREFRKMGLNDLLGAISRYHRGLKSVRKDYGYEQLQKPKDYWKDFENVVSEMVPIIKKLGDFPKQKELNEIGANSLAIAISKYHGGFATFRGKLREYMGEAEGTDPDNHLESLLDSYVGGEE